MQIHVFNHPAFPEMAIDQAQWDRAGLTSHRVSFGGGKAEFDAVADQIEVLVTPPWGMEAFDLGRAKRLKLVQTTSAGVDNMLRLDKVPPGVLLANNRGVHAEKAGQYAAMAILMLVNRLPVFFTDQRAGRWRRVSAPLAATRRLTVIGLGSLGGAAAAQGRRLGMPVTGIRGEGGAHPSCDETLGPAALDQVLPRTDILLLACPLTPATHHILSAARIALLPPGAGVINIGRGALIDQAALFDALDDNRLAGAILDVFETEPIPQDDRAWRTPNLVITPHMSADDLATYNSSTLAILAANLAALAVGQVPPTLVDLERGY